jgi:hypothetical protein
MLLRHRAHMGEVDPFFVAPLAGFAVGAVITAEELIVSPDWLRA